jgi:hypothetical protein
MENLEWSKVALSCQDQFKVFHYPHIEGTAV